MVCGQDAELFAFKHLLRIQPFSSLYRRSRMSNVDFPATWRGARQHCCETFAATDNNQPVPCRDNKLDACSCYSPLVEESNGKRRGGDI
jgi:hypothetical protein